MSNQQTFDFLTGCSPPSETQVQELSSRKQKRERESQPVRAGNESCFDRRDRQSFLPDVVEETVKDLHECSAPLVSESPDRESMLRKLRIELGCGLPESENETLTICSTGSEAIDGMLPRGGLRRDTITEWVAEAEGCGAAALSLITAANILNVSVRSGPLVVVSGETGFYPPAAVALGVPADRIIWVRPERHADFVWAIDQALRCESVAAVWAHAGPHLDDRDARRFQLASEAGQTAGLLVRPAASRGKPSFAEVRFHVRHLATMPDLYSVNRFGNSRGSIPETAVQSQRMLQVTVDRCRGGTAGQQTTVTIDDRGNPHTMPSHQESSRSVRCLKDGNEKAAVYLATELAHPKIAKRVISRRRA